MNNRAPDDLADVENWLDWELSEVKWKTFLLVLSAQGPLTVGMYLSTAGRAMWFSESMLKNPWEEDREGRGGWIDTGERDRGQGEDICTNNIWCDSNRLWGWGRQMKLGGIGYTERRERY